MVKYYFMFIVQICQILNYFRLFKLLYYLFHCYNPLMNYWILKSVSVGVFPGDGVSVQSSYVCFIYDNIYKNAFKTYAENIISKSVLLKHFLKMCVKCLLITV